MLFEEADGDRAVHGDAADIEAALLKHSKRAAFCLRACYRRKRQADWLRLIHQPPRSSPTSENAFRQQLQHEPKRYVVFQEALTHFLPNQLRGRFR